MNTPEKPTLLQLRRAYNHQSGKMMTSQQLATMAVIPPAEEFQMELGCPINQESAHRVMEAFSVLTGRTYTLDDISVSLKATQFSHLPKGATP